MTWNVSRLPSGARTVTVMRPSTGWSPTPRTVPALQVAWLPLAVQLPGTSMKGGVLERVTTVPVAAAVRE